MKASDGHEIEKKVTGHAGGTGSLVFFWGEASLELLFWGQPHFPNNSVLKAASTLFRKKQIPISQ
jgi:hypothetical protein